MREQPFERLRRVSHPEFPQDRDDLSAFGIRHHQQLRLLSADPQMATHADDVEAVQIEVSFQRLPETFRDGNDLARKSRLRLHLSQESEHLLGQLLTPARRLTLSSREAQANGQGKQKRDATHRTPSSFHNQLKPPDTRPLNALYPIGLIDAEAIDGTFDKGTS